MTPAVRARVEHAILRALARRPLTGPGLAERLRAVPGCLADADGWTLLLRGLSAAGRVRRVGTGRDVRWATVTPPAPAAAGGRASATPTRAA